MAGDVHAFAPSCRLAASRRAPQAAEVERCIRPETAPLWMALRDVLDPEIPVSVVDLG